MTRTINEVRPTRPTRHRHPSDARRSSANRRPDAWRLVQQSQTLRARVRARRVDVVDCVRHLLIPGPLRDRTSRSRSPRATARATAPAPRSHRSAAWPRARPGLRWSRCARNENQTSRSTRRLPRRGRRRRRRCIDAGHRTIPPARSNGQVERPHIESGPPTRWSRTKRAVGIVSGVAHVSTQVAAPRPRTTMSPQNSTSPTVIVNTDPDGTPARRPQGPLGRGPRRSGNQGCARASGRGSRPGRLRDHGPGPAGRCGPGSPVRRP